MPTDRSRLVIPAPAHAPLACVVILQLAIALSLVIGSAGCEARREEQRSLAAPAPAPVPRDVCERGSIFGGDRPESLYACSVSGTDAEELAAAGWLLPRLGGGTVGAMTRTPRVSSPRLLFLGGRFVTEFAVGGLSFRGVPESLVSERRNEAAATHDILWVTVTSPSGFEPTASSAPLCNGWRALCVEGARPAEVDWDCAGPGAGCASTEGERDQSDALSWVVQFNDRACAAAQFGTLDQPRDPTWDERLLSEGRACKLLEDGRRELEMAREMGVLGH